jgi:hypothetical protein
LETLSESVERVPKETRLVIVLFIREGEICERIPRRVEEGVWSDSGVPKVLKTGNGGDMEVFAERIVGQTNLQVSGADWD